MDDETKQILRKVKEEKVRRMMFEKYRYYEPNGAIEKAIDYFASGEYFIVFMSAANGVGKSVAGANILAHLMWPIKDNKYFNKGVFQDWPYLKQGRIVTDSSLVDKNIVEKLQEWFPHGRYKATKAGKHYLSKWETDTGWKFDIMTYQQEPREFEGVTLGWAWFDEPPPDAILKATIARMRKGGIIFIGATPIGGSAHLYDSLVTGKMEVEISTREGQKPEKVVRKVAHVTADIESACKQHGVRGHLEHDDIVKMLSEYDPDELQARAYGKFAHLIGLVFKRFSRDIHVIKPFPVTHHDFVVQEMLDPHPRNPDAVLWLATDRKGTKYVVDELYINPEDIKELAFRIKKKADQYRIVQRLADPSAFVKDHHRERNLASMLADEGLHYQEATKTRTVADERIKTALNYQEVNGHIIRPPELYIFETCERTIWEFEHYRWSEWKGRAAEERDRKEKPVDKDDHMIENLGRGLVQEMAWAPYRKPGSVGEMTSEDFDPY